MKSFLYITIIALTISYGIAQTPAAKVVTEKEATLAAGCFWHEETLFESIKGVNDVVSGYAGGTTKDPSYEKIETGTTGHAETVNIKYDPTKITYEELLKVFVESMSTPTQLNGQGPDKGTQYRSIIFYRTPQEKKIAEDYILKVNKSGKYKGIVTVEIVPYTTFYTAEAYHQDYIKHNPDNGYVQTVSIPEIKKYQMEHPLMIKPDKKIKY